MSSAQIEKKILQGDLGDDHATDKSASLAALYRRYSGDVRGYVIAKFGDVDVEEIVQTVFFKLARLKNLPDLPYPKGYLFRIADHTVIDESRKATVRDNYIAETVLDAPENLRDELTPERVVNAKRELALVTKAIKMLPERQQRLLMLFRVGGLNYLQIARITKVPRSTVQREVARGAAKLDRLLCSMREE